MLPQIQPAFKTISISKVVVKKKVDVDFTWKLVWLAHSPEVWKTLEERVFNSNYLTVIESEIGLGRNDRESRRISRDLRRQ